jgi:hypothetical protein
MSSSQIRRTGEGGRIGAERKKTEPERRRTKACWWGKWNLLKNTNPAKILVFKDQHPQEFNNLKEKEVLLHYHLRRHNADILERKAKERGESQPTTALSF